MNRRQFCAAVCAGWSTSHLFAKANAAAPAGANLSTEVFMQMTSKTAGGKQFWADRWFFHDWRIQRHVLTGHCRLLDGKDRRHAWGSFESCRETLDEIRRRDQLPPMHGKAVIVLHGLFRTRATMERLRTALASDGGYTVFSMGYPTTRGSLSDHAESLDSVVASLEGIAEINFVAHSLGNLVVRHWLHNFAEQARSLPAGQSFGRMVMLAPPNLQPELAAKLIRGALVSFVAGPAAQQLANGWDELQRDDDAVVTVDSTRLPLARDFRLLPVLHSFFMNDSRVHEMTRTFLAHGYFESDATRQPIDAA
jgi:pimeloyl-ACP methyl ester carboxylesterase